MPGCSWFHNPTTLPSPAPSLPQRGGLLSVDHSVSLVTRWPPPLGLSLSSEASWPQESKDQGWTRDEPGAQKPPTISGGTNVICRGQYSPNGSWQGCQAWEPELEWSQGSERRRKTSRPQSQGCQAQEGWGHWHRGRLSQGMSEKPEPARAQGWGRGGMPKETGVSGSVKSQLRHVR